MVYVVWGNIFLAGESGTMLPQLSTGAAALACFSQSVSHDSEYSRVLTTTDTDVSNVAEDHQA